MTFYLWVLHALNCTVECGAQRCKTDQDVHLRVLLHGIGHVLIDWHQDFFVAPIELLLVIPTGQQEYIGR